MFLGGIKRDQWHEMNEQPFRFLLEIMWLSISTVLNTFTTKATFAAFIRKVGCASIPHLL